MAQVFFSAILPVFAVALIGYLAGKRGIFDAASAMAVNRFVFMIAVPALLFRLVSGTPVDAFPLAAVAGYLAVEFIIIAAGALLAWQVFRSGRVESLLIGMTAGFSNHVFIILPITLALYGEAGAAPVVAIIFIDATFVFGAGIVILDLMTSDARGNAAQRLTSLLLRNPPVIAMIAGLAVAFSGLPVPEGLVFFTRFLGDAGPPASLFALGVVLAGRTARSSTLAPAAITGLKLAAMPLLVWALFAGIAPIGGKEAGIVLLTSTGPCGAMPFVMALQFGAPAETIARAILYSTVASAFLIAAVLGLMPPA